MHFWFTIVSSPNPEESIQVSINLGIVEEIHSIFIQNGLLFSLKKEGNHVIRHTMDEPRDQYAK